ncbi:hypothetical protein PABG_05661 [Paracoccidioides brasiliensis Pb03]|nr:hypothetical protein PABG_05661 [Paracoccidioides brasiliensis Pb03]
MIQSDAGKEAVFSMESEALVYQGRQKEAMKQMAKGNQRAIVETIKRSNESNCNNLLAKRSPLAKVPGGGLLMFRLPRNAAMLHAAPVSSRAIAMFCVEIEEAEVLVMAMANRTEDTLPLHMEFLPFDNKHELVFLVWHGHQHLVVKCRYPSYSPNPISPKMTAE